MEDIYANEKGISCAYITFVCLNLGKTNTERIHLKKKIRWGFQ